MAFSFSFSGADIEKDENGPDEVVQNMVQVDLPADLSVKPKRHTLERLLYDLPDQFEYNMLSIHLNPGHLSLRDYETINEKRHTLAIPRRSIHDIRLQLMAEANPTSNSNEILISHIDRGDLTAGSYEGGFKTWECALDLAGLLLHFDLSSRPTDWHIIELGAGSAIPSLTLLHRVEEFFKHFDGLNQRFRFTLCDYNEDVLRLATAPNLMLTSTHARRDQMYSWNHENADAFDISQSFHVDEVELRSQLFQSNNQCMFTQVDFVSGAWGKGFADVVCDPSSERRDSANRPRQTLILASETIYSPSSIATFTETLIELLQRCSQPAKALVAAKRIYFGVGGGVDEFVQHAESKGVEIKEVFKVSDEGVGRVILEATLKAGEGMTE